MCREMQIDLIGSSSEATTKSIKAAIKTTFEKEKVKFLQEYSVQLQGSTKPFSFVFERHLAESRVNVHQEFDATSKDIQEHFEGDAQRVALNYLFNMLIGQQDRCSVIMHQLELSKRKVRKTLADAALHVDVKCFDVQYFDERFLNNIVEKCRKEFQMRIETFDATLPELATLRSKIANTEYARKLCDDHGLDAFPLKCVQFFISSLNTEMSKAIQKLSEVSKVEI